MEKNEGETDVQPGDDGDDADDNVHLVGRPTDDEGGVDHFDNDGDALGRQPGADEDDGGGEYEDDRRDPKQEHVSWGMEKRPFGTVNVRGRAWVKGKRRKDV
jgi:hypothetical protein